MQADSEVGAGLARRTRALAALNHHLLQAYSRRTLDELRGLGPVRLVLPHVEPLLALNVEKEARKDALVIKAGADALAAGVNPGRDETRRLMDEARQIDREFLRRADAFPIGIDIRYEDVAPVRRERIEHLLSVARRMLEMWRERRSLRPALRESYPRRELERDVDVLLRLYAQETQALARSVRLPFPLSPLRDRLAASLNRIMQTAGGALARDLSRQIYEQSRR